MRSPVTSVVPSSEERQLAGRLGAVHLQRREAGDQEVALAEPARDLEGEEPLLGGRRGDGRVEGRGQLAGGAGVVGVGHGDLRDAAEGSDVLEVVIAERQRVDEHAAAGGRPAGAVEVHVARGVEHRPAEEVVAVELLHVPLSRGRDDHRRLSSHLPSS
jgi:hypothetical protein